MQLDFQQGVITYPSTGANQQFLADSGTGVSLQTVNGRVDITFAAGLTRNYLLTEASDVVNAWVGLPSTGVNSWLYWDIDVQTGVRTFGLTLIQPFVGPVAPIGAGVDQHWFDTSTNKMNVFGVGGFRQVIRVFAAKYDGIIFTPLGTGFGGKPFAGTQVGSTIAGSTSGRILVDNLGNPIRTADNALMTTEDEIFVNGSPINTVRLDATVINATALEPMSRYQVVALTQFDKINLADYDDTGSLAIGMVMEDLLTGQTGTLCIQGYISNPLWNFTTPGAPLWISTAGQLSEIDPHLADPITYNIGRVPVGRVFSPTSILFDQGLGGKGDSGADGSATINVATTTVLGVAKIATAAADINNPIVVGDNDPRNSNARAPLPHVQAAATITTVAYGTLTGGNAAVQLQEIEDGKVKKAGDTMTGSLILSADPTINLEAATKQYVDAKRLIDLADVNAVGVIAGQVLTYNGTNWTPQMIGLTFPLFAPDFGPQYSFSSNNQAGLMYAPGTGPSSDNRVTLIASNAISLNTIPSAVEVYGGGMFGQDVTTLNYQMLGGGVLAGGGNVTGTGGSLVASTGFYQNGNGNFVADAPDSSPMTISSSQARVEPSVYTAATDVLHAGGFTFTVAANSPPARTDGGQTRSGGFTFTSAPADTVESFLIQHGLPTGYSAGQQILEFTAFGEIIINGDAGSPNQVLTSAGAGQPANWSNVPTSEGVGGSPSVGIYRLFGNSTGDFSGNSYSDWTYQVQQSSDDVEVTYGNNGWTINTPGAYEIIVAMAAQPAAGNWPDNPTVYGTRVSNATSYHDQSNYSSTGGAGISSFALLGTGNNVQHRKWTDRFIVDSTLTGNQFNVYAYGNSYGGGGIGMFFTAEVTIRRISPLLP